MLKLKLPYLQPRMFVMHRSLVFAFLSSNLVLLHLGRITAFEVAVVTSLSSELYWSLLVTSTSLSYHIKKKETRLIEQKSKNPIHR
jgi:hypothetical protein